MFLTLIESMGYELVGLLTGVPALQISLCDGISGLIQTFTIIILSEVFYTIKSLISTGIGCV